ncbi:MAG: hypothetical protein ACREP4_10615 [Stenotrophomonas sp.]|uniref:hypothetical protein n=1 Tax=Stenotrophomonas sp. TaxID=69392 RepID=UPI003D6C9CA0
MRAGRFLVKAGAVMLLAAVSWGATAQQAPLQEELVNPSEVVFEGGQAYADAGGGRLERLHSRKQGGETIYYRMVRYDDEGGYVGDDRGAVASQNVGSTGSLGATPYRYYGNGNLSRPDYYNSPYNRDARQRYWGPGYFGSCSRYDGCREVQYVPLVPVVPVVPYHRSSY